MVAALNTTKLKDLLTVESNPCLSIYLSTHERGPDIREDPIRFKNLLRQCKRDLKERGFAGEHLKIILQPAMDMLETSIAWHYHEQGLVVFMSAETFQVFTLPFKCQELAWVGTHFYIKPLAPLWRAEKRFCILALSQGQAKFYEADQRGMVEKKLANAPQNLQAFLKYHEIQKHMQCHTAPSGTSNGTGAIFHGQGNIADNAKRKRTMNEYVKAVRSAVEGYLAGDHRPLLLVAPKYIQSVYREVSRYHYLLTTDIQQSPDRLREAQLNHAAQEAVRAYFERVTHNHLARYQALLSNGGASDKIEEIIPAAAQGRVYALFLDPFASMWCRRDRVAIRNGSVEPGKKREDLLDAAVRWTLSRGGDVYAVAQTDLPSQSPAGALFRY